MSARRGGGGDFLSSKMFSADWLDNFNANLVFIIATRVSDFVGNFYSFFMNFKLLKMRSTGAFEQGKQETKK